MRGKDKHRYPSRIIKRGAGQSYGPFAPPSGLPAPLLFESLSTFVFLSRRRAAACVAACRANLLTFVAVALVFYEKKNSPHLLVRFWELSCFYLVKVRVSHEKGKTDSVDGGVIAA